MSTLLKIISTKEIGIFDAPPEFNGDDRKKFFSISVWAKKILKGLRTPTNKTGFVLQLGYFKAVNKFFVASKFHNKDVEFVVKNLGLPIEDVNFDSYIKATHVRHQAIILHNLGFKKFNENAKKLITHETFTLSSKQTKPRLMFLSIVDFLQGKKIEVPTYNAISIIITQTLKEFEKNLVSLLDKNLLAEDRKILDELLKENDEYGGKEKRDLKLKRYRLTMLKKSDQSTKPSRIKENVSDLRFLHTFYRELEPVIDRLGLSPEITQYYAQTVIKSKMFQILRREEKRHLLLLTFVVHQFYRLNDVLIEILLQSTQSILNSSVRENKEKYFDERKSKHKNIDKLTKKVTRHLDILGQIKATVQDLALSDGEKIREITRMLPDEQNQTVLSLQEELEFLGKDSTRIIKNDDYYEILESKSLKLQNRVSEIVKSLEFDKDSSNRRLIKGIEYFQKMDGIIKNPPLDFLSAEKQEKIYNELGKIRVSLYKTLLFDHIASGIKSGALNLKYSYKYRPFDDYLIPKEVWERQKDDLLDKAGLTELSDFDSLKVNLNKAVKEQFKITNENISTGKNQYATIEKDGHVKVQTPREEKEEAPETLMDLFPKHRFIPLFEILSTVNKLCKFTDAFEHWQVKNNRKRPLDHIFIAAIIGYGCNLGIRKVAKISRNIHLHELENTVNWFFTNDNIIVANDLILAITEKLQLPSIYLRNPNYRHTSSDGQKFNVSVESLNASYSYKYFGKGKGVSAYSFIDESHRLFYSTVINSSEREAAYVIDGLLHNDVVQSDIHSTDTHGYSENIFAVSHLLGVSFAPRIKKFADQILYAFESRSEMKKLGYDILPKGKINTKLIEEYWDDVLRLVATIKLKESTASQLFRRLSSYSKRHPLYRALKEFGRIIKTIFLLKYIDDVGLRQAIEKQLNKLESSNKFGKAVFHGNNQEFEQPTKEEQMIAEGCKRLIENAIIGWNYLYLSQMVANTDNQHERRNLLDVIKNGSVVSWGHVNLQGEFDFSKKTLKNTIEFNLPELLDLHIV